MIGNERAIREAVELLKPARQNPPQVLHELPLSCRPTCVDDAMRIQAELNRHLANDGLGEIIGTKIGCTTPVMQDYLGMEHPCAGGIFSSTLHFGTGQFDHSRFLHVGVECEIAVRLGRSILAREAPHDLSSVQRCIRSIHAAIEIVDDRYFDFEAGIPGWQTWVADNFFGAGAVLGPPIPQWHRIPLESVRGVMRINGKPVGSGYGREIIDGHPLAALVWLANEESRAGRDLRENWIVLLGSVVRTHWVDRGDEIHVELSELGEAHAVFG